MIAFELWHNGQRIAVAGGQDLHTLVSIMRWVDGESDIDVCGLNDIECHVFADVPLHVGDELLIRIKDVGDVDLTAPIRRTMIEEIPSGAVSSAESEKGH